MLSLTVCVTATTAPVLAGPDDDKAAAPASGDPAAAPAGGEPASADPASPPKQVEYGVGVRLRSVRAPQGMLELFVDRAPGGVSNIGFGVDLMRRRGNTELHLGFEYEKIQPAEGVWIEKNANVATGDEADYIVSPDNNNGKSLGWFTIEFTFLHHTPLHEKLALRYGFGAGLGIVTGELGRYNVVCVGATNSAPEPGCVPTELGGNGQPSPDGAGIQKYNLPPVFPVVNAIFGLQVRPIRALTINLEGGIRTFPFFGASAGYFF